MRRWLIAAALLTFAGEAQAYVRSGVGVVGHGFRRVVASAPVLVGDGVTAGLDFNFASGSFVQAGQAGTTPAALLTVTRASTKYCDDLAGNWSQVAANTLCYSNKGALIEEARTNLFLNSQAPVTQTITVASASVYTVSLYGTGTLTLSGAGTGVVSQGTRVTFTAGTTSLTVTVAGTGGAFVNAQVELGTFASSPIVTAGAAATRNADIVKTTAFPTLGAAYSFYGSAQSITPGANPLDQSLFGASDGTTNNQIRLYRAATTGTQAFLSRAVSVTTAAGAGACCWSNGANGKLAASYAAGAQAGVFNGGTAGTTAAAGLPVGLTQIDIGQNSNAATGMWSGYLRRVALWPATALTTGALQSITSGGGP